MIPTPRMSGAKLSISCIHVISPTAATNAETAPTAGHGLGLTRW